MSTETRRIQFDFFARDRNVRRTTEDVTESVEDMNDGLEAGSGRMGRLGQAAGKLGPALAVVAGAAALIGPAIAKGLDAQQATAKFQAQLGLTAKESKRIGAVAGKLYSQAYGENLDEVRVAITAVIRNMDGMRTASSADLQAMSARAMTLAKIMDEEVGRTMAAVGQIMRTGLARNAEEAFDLMTRGAQLGANKAEDLADTFEEYSVQFKNMGLDGKQAMGLIVQGLQAGGRNADLVADTIKEFSIEAVAGAERVSGGFKSLGLDADAMSAKFAKGGKPAAQALDQVFDKLRAIEDPVKRNRVAIELFGTKAEDMGKALFALDPSEATRKMNGFANATDKAGDALGSTWKSKLTSWKRTVETSLMTVADRAITKLDKIGGEIKKGFDLPKTGKAKNDWQALGKIFRDVATWAKKELIPALKDLGVWFDKKIAPQIKKFYREVLKELWKTLKDVGKELKGADVPWGKLLKAFKKIYEFGTKYLLTWWGGELKLAIKLVGKAVVAVVKGFELLWKTLKIGWGVIKRTWEAFQKLYKLSKPALDKLKDTVMRGAATMTRVFLNFVSAVINGAARAFGWVPKLGGKLRKAAKDIEGFKNKTNREIDKITSGKKVNIKVTASGSISGFSRGGGSGMQQAYAKGGRVWTTDPSASQAYDSVPAMLRLNEHVWTPEEVEAAGGHGAMYRLRAAAKKGLLKGYATGGPVGVDVKASLPSEARMDSIWNSIEARKWAMVMQVAKMLAKMFGANGVVNAARSMIGYPYSWGGGGKGGPSYGIGRGSGTYGFDCSGLTEYAWWKGAGVSIGGTTYSQWPNSVSSARRPGALGFPHMGHVVVASDRPGYIIEAPYTGAHVRERAGSGYSWRWPRGARFYAGGMVGQAARAAFRGTTSSQETARALGMLGDPGRRRGRGGAVAAGLPYLVGEHGPEVVIPGGAGTVERAGSRVVVVNQHIDVCVKVPPSVDRGQVGREINEALKEYKRRGGQIVTAGGRN